MNAVIALDQSEFARQIVDAVVNRQWPAHTQFNVVTVIEPLQWESVSCIEWNEVAVEALNRRKLIAHETLMEAKRRISQAVAGCEVHVETRHGSPRDQILNVASEWMADKIVLGAHGYHTQLTTQSKHHAHHHFAGSVSRAVALRAPCCVEFVRLKSIPVDEAARKKEKKSHISTGKKK